MRFGGGLSICVAGGLLALVLAPPLSAQTAGCSKYAIFGLSPGMSHRDVWEIMNGKGERATVLGISGRVSTSVYHLEGGSITVQYDREITKREDARVAVLQAEVGLILDDLVARLGAPAEGAEYLGQRQPEGDVVWTDAACGVKVTVYTESRGWWEPARATMNVEVRSLPVVGGASTSQIANPATDSNGRVPEAAPAPVAAKRSLAGGPSSAVHEPAAAGGRSPTATAPQTGAGAERLEPDARRGSSEVPYTAGVGGVSIPERIERSYVRAEYPTAAARAQLSGRVVMQAVVKKDGSISDVLVLSCSQPNVGFEEAAVEAVKQWRFQPATLNGRAVDAYTTVTIQFR